MNPHRQAQYNKRRFRIDKFVQRGITLFGWMVLGMFALIIWHVFSNAAPLLQEPSLRKLSTISSSQLVSGKDTQIIGALELGVGDIIAAREGCDLLLHKIDSSSLAGVSTNSMHENTKRIPFPCAYDFRLTSANGNHQLAVMTPNHILELYDFNELGQTVSLNLLFSVSLPLDAKVFKDWTVNIQGNKVLVLFRDTQRALSFWFDSTRPDNVAQFAHSGQAFEVLPALQQLAVQSGRKLDFYDHHNRLIDSKILDRDIHKIIPSPTGRSLYISYLDGSFEKWSVLNQQGTFVFRAHEQGYADLDSPITQMVFDANTNAAIAINSQGEFAFVNTVSFQLFDWQPMQLDVGPVFWMSKRVYATQPDALSIFVVDNIQGITSFSSLVAKVQYEGYQAPQYVWQTSSASSHYELKNSVVPLIIGSLKASFLALLVAVPLALGAAVYTAYFADAGVRTLLKPVIEMLEAVPSVIIGFIAAVWLAPLAEEFLLSILLFIILLPLFLLLAAYVQPKLNELLKHRFDRKWEVVYILLYTLLLATLCFALSDVWQQLIITFAGNEAGTKLSISKTGIVLAIALGIAISPTIYSLSEDALFEVPSGIKQAAFALGATHLQTLKHVIFVVAFPSILSAIMLGFGRAFGETMIVLMVTGNTPIANGNILEGLRSLTANLAIELQESQIDSTHFNLLFLTASLLFVFTFIVNTGAEILRRRLRKVDTYAE